MLTMGLVACSNETPDPEALAAEQTRNAEMLGTYQANQQLGENGLTDAWVPNSTPIPTISTVSLGGAEETPLPPLQTQGTMPVVATPSVEPNRTPTPTRTAAVTTPTRTAAVTTPTRTAAVQSPTRTTTVQTPTRTAALPSPTRTAIVQTPTRTTAVNTPTRTAALPSPTRTSAVQTPTRTTTVQTPTRTAALPSPTRTATVTTFTRTATVTTPTRTAALPTPTRTAVLPTQTAPVPPGWEGEWTVFLGQEGGPYTTGTLSVKVEGNSLRAQTILDEVSYEFIGEVNQSGQYVLGDYTQDSTAGWFYWTLLSDVQFGGTLDNHIGFCASKGGTQPPDPCVYYLIS